MFNVFGYGRASTDHQVLSTDQQHTKVKDAFGALKTIKPNWGEAVWGGFIPDEATARTSCFRQRNGGSLVLAACKPGDVILVSNYDRIFASVVDVCETLPLLSQMKVGLIVLDAQIDTTTDIGEFCFKMLALVKELHVKDIRRSTRENIAHRKRLGRPYCKMPIGWKHALVRVPGINYPQRYVVADNAARRLAREVLRQKQNAGHLSYEQVAQWCNSIGLKQKSGRRWTVPTFIAWCRAAESDFPLPNGSHEPAPIPPNAEPVTIETISAAD